MKMSRSWLVSLVVLSIWAGMATPSQASLILLTSRAGLTDSIDWAQTGPEGTPVLNPSNVLSVNSLAFTVGQGDGNFLRLDQGSGWTGNFAFGDRLLWTTGSGPITLSGPNISAIGTQIQSDYYGDFIAKITAYDSADNVLGSFTESGNSNGAGDNSAIFIGVRSDSINIAKIVLSLDSAPFDTTSDFAINTVSLDTNLQAAPVPAGFVMSSIGVFGIGAFGWLRRRKFQVA